MVAYRCTAPKQTRGGEVRWVIKRYFVRLITHFLLTRRAEDIWCRASNLSTNRVKCIIVLWKLYTTTSSTTSHPAKTTLSCSQMFATRHTATTKKKKKKSTLDCFYQGSDSWEIQENSIHQQCQVLHEVDFIHRNN